MANRDFGLKLFQELQEHRKKLAQMKESGMYTTKAIEEEKQKIVEETKNRINSWKEQEIQKRQKKIEELRRQSRKKGLDYQELDKATYLMKSLSDDDLQDVADKLLKGEISATEEQKLALTVELRDRGFSRLAEHIRQAREPEHPEVQRLQEEISLLESAYSEDLITIEKDDEIEFRRVEDVLEGRDENVVHLVKGQTRID